MKILTPTTPVDQCTWDCPSIFLAGSIEMGRAIRWQDRFIEQFSERDVVFLNPRRDDWDNCIEQTREDPQFRAQVQWELYMLNRADLIVMNFEPGTISPVSLLELGLFANSRKMIVCSPEGFHRKGNVDIVCDWMQVSQVSTFKDLLNYVDNWIGDA